MPALVADTHAAVWYLLNDPRLSVAAGEAFDGASGANEPIFVSAISLVELTYLVEKGRVPAAALQKLRAALSDSRSAFVVANVDLAVADTIARVQRDSIPDLPDRVIAATALVLNLPLVSRDRKIRAADITTLW